MKTHKSLQTALNDTIQILKTGNKELAIQYLLDYCRKQPDNAEIRCEIGKFLQQNNMPFKAEIFYRDSLSINKQQATIHFNLGVIYQNLNKVNEAINEYTAATEIDSKYARAYANLGYLYNENGDKDKCRDACLAAQELDPENPQIKHMVAALGIEEAPEIADKEYIKNLYDGYANSYDSHLSVTLKSQTPQLVYDKTIEYAGNNNTHKKILDLGCGTGICGELFKPHADTLIGIDLSEKMIKQAQKKNIYTSLHISDIIEHLNNNEIEFDYIVSSDVLIYIGNLLELFKAAKKSLKENGLFTFSVESTLDTSDDYILGSTGRYQHNHQYISGIAEQCGFSILSSNEAPLRQQNNKDVIGRIYALSVAEKIKPNL